MLSLSSSSDCMAFARKAFARKLCCITNSAIIADAQEQTSITGTCLHSTVPLLLHVSAVKSIWQSSRFVSALVQVFLCIPHLKHVTWDLLLCLIACQHSEICCIADRASCHRPVSLKSAWQTHIQDQLSVSDMRDRGWAQPGLNDETQCLKLLFEECAATVK